MPHLTPEAQARLDIDRQLEAAGWTVQDRDRMDIFNHRAVAVREFSLTTGFADYLLIVDKKAIGVVEAKPVGTTLSGVTHQSQQYSAGLPAYMNAWHLPLPYLYQSTGIETTFRDDRDPEPRSRRVFTFHRPETLVRWVEQGQTLRARLRALPMVPLPDSRLWQPQQHAISGLEDSLARNDPRALIQMATGAGKTYTAISILYRLIKHVDIGRVLFLVDRTNLGLQAYKEFQAFETPLDGRKFTELYNVQHLTSNTPNPDNVDVFITTIQRFYSILKTRRMSRPQCCWRVFGGRKVAAKNDHPLVDSTGNEWRFFPDKMYITPWIGRKWSKKKIIQTYNQSRNCARIGETYSEKSLSSKRFEVVFADIVGLIERSR